MILMMAALLRESEAANLDAGDMWLERIEDEEALYVYVGKSKADEMRKGHSVIVGKATKQPGSAQLHGLTYAKRKNIPRTSPSADRMASHCMLLSLTKSWRSC